MEHKLTKSENGDGEKPDLNNHIDEDELAKNMNNVKLDLTAMRSNGDETKWFETEKDDLELGTRIGAMPKKTIGTTTDQIWKKNEEDACGNG